jgi:hypothetical protein
MSDLLNSASLVMIPSGYKEDTVFSAIPSDGSGDLSFTRASNGTRVNSAGLVEVCPWNFVEQSETFDNASWAKNTGGTSTVTVTANNGIAPNGTTTADRIQLTRDSSGFAQVAQTVTTTTSQSYTFSVYLKSLSGTPTIMFGSFGGTNAQTATLTNEWVRYTWTATSPSTSAFALLMIWGGIGSTSLSADFLAWGYQLVEGSSAKPYFPTTDRLNVPRLTYQNGGGGCPSLLLEKQSTNLITYSEQFDDAGWLKLASSVTSNSTTSPDGTQNADTNTVDTSSNEHGIAQVLSIASGFNTISVYLKPNGATAVRIGFANDDFGGMTAAQRFAYFDLSNGTVLQSISGGTTTIQNVGNGWYRCIVTQNLVSGSSGGAVQILLTQGTTTFYTGNGTDGVFIWGAQLEASSYPTSYIPTTSASATRVADACFKTGISSLIGQTGGVWFADYILNGQTSNANILNSEKNTTCALFMSQQSDGDFDAGLYVSGSLVGRIVAPVGLTVGQRVKVAYAYESGNIALYINGNQAGVLSSTFTFPTTLDDIFLSDEVYFNYPESIKFNQVAIFKTRLTNAELASLTTI